MITSTQKSDYITIGELSRLTGITTHNLRMWERRYGAPEAVRLPSGHRRYPKDEILRLRAISKALESGYRASKVVGCTLEELQLLLNIRYSSGEPFSGHDSKGVVSDWIRAVREYDEDHLVYRFHETWNQKGPMAMIQNFVAPFIQQVGFCWQTGTINVSHEHFATELLSNFLSKKFQQLNQHKEGPVVMLTTLPEETHQLGLIMCAVISALTECRIVYLGSNMPYREIISAINTCPLKVLCISVSKCSGPEYTEDTLYKLRSALSPNIKIVVGGAGAPKDIPGITNFQSFSEFYQWMAKI